MARTPAWGNPLVPSFIALSVALVFILVSTPAEAQPSPNFPPFPDLLHAQQTDRSKWDLLGKIIWFNLTNIDFDFVKDNKIVPPGNDPDIKFVTPVVCGRVARIWIRMPFHDCGTYSILTGQGGCDGSLRKELPSSMTISTPQGDIDVFQTLGDDAARALDDVGPFDPSRLENTGMAASTSFFYSMKFAAERFGLSASWADVMIYAGHLSVAMCGGPLILFVPGRKDSPTANVPGALPAPTDSGNQILHAFRRMGLMPLDGVMVQSAHTTACFAAGCLDSTPDQFDNKWACEVLNYNKNTDKVCTFPGTFPADSQARCIAPFDLQLAKRPDIRAMIQLVCWNTEDRTELTKRIVLSQGPYGYGSGVLWRVNLCGKRAPCRRDQCSYFNLFATSYFRMTSLGLSKSWTGFSYSGAGDYNIGGATNDIPQDRNDRIRGWGISYIFKRGPWNSWRKIKR